MDHQGAPYITPAWTRGKVASYVEDLEYAKNVYNKTLELVDLPKDYLEKVLGNKILVEGAKTFQDFE